ncbi:unnamed protein product [Caenorhabditis brenneri]
MTIQFLTRDISSHHPMLLVHDYENTEAIVKFEGFTCLTGQDCGVFELDATKGAVALQSIYSGWHAEKDIVTNYESTDGEMDVHLGGAKKEKTNTAAFFTYSMSREPNIENGFPDIIYGPLKTYVLRNGTAKISITRNWDAFGKIAKFGRKGHVSSNYYFYFNDRQHAFEEISAPEGETRARFTFNVNYADMNENSSLRILGSENGTDVYQKIQPHPPRKPQLLLPHQLGGPLHRGLNKLHLTRLPQLGRLLRRGLNKPQLPRIRQLSGLLRRALKNL